MSGQKTMTVRMEEMLLRLIVVNGVRVSVLDRRVLKRLIKQGKAKIINTNSRAPVVNGRKFVIANSAMAVATTIPPITEEVNTGGPGAKRKAAMEESGLTYRGKTWGKVRVDLPREAREKRISDKKKMWAMLKHHKNN